MAFLALTSAQCDADSPVDETLTQLIRTNFDDHESRIGANESLTDQDIRDSFACNTLNDSAQSPYTWDKFVSGGETLALDGAPDHYLHFTSNAAVGALVCASPYKMRFDLDRNHSLVMEVRHKSGNSDNASTWLIGFQDDTLGAAITGVTTQDNIIAFVQSGTAQQYKARCVKATAGATVADNLGNAANWTKLKITVTSTGSGASITVRFFVDDVETSGSPFTTLANIPLVKMKPLIGFSGGGGSRNYYVDYAKYYWTATPLSN